MNEAYIGLIYAAGGVLLLIAGLAIGMYSGRKWGG